MKNSKLLALGISEAFDWLDQVVNDLTPEQYAYQPAGSANPISKLHAHTLSSADFWMNLMGLGKPMVWLTFSEKTGLPSNWIEIWKHDGEIKLSDMQDYAAKLRACLADVEALDDTALEREVHAPFFGRRDAGFVYRLAGTQLALHTGEISAAKGLQGLQGLPF
jgi:DinB superfamily